MRPSLLPHSGYVIIILGVLLILAGREITKLQGVIAARPAIADKVVTRTVKGPVRIVLKTVIAPDGTKTVEKVLDRGETVIDRAAEHAETPACAPLRAPRTRYAGLGVDPLRYAALPRLRAGVTLWDRLDAGIAYDARFSPVAGAFGLELAYRF